MPVEHSPWLLPLAESAYKHREEIGGAWRRLSAVLLGEKRVVAFTGCAGVGKTVLLDYLTQDAYEQSYRPLTSRRKRKKVDCRRLGNKFV